MRLKIDRRWKKATYTVGILYVDGVRFCETLEDKDRDLLQTDYISVIKAIKVYGETAIPMGSYWVSLDVLSPKYAGVKWYRDLCEGKMPRLLEVPGFEGILIHPGNHPLDTYGCILVGRNTKVGQLTESKATFQRLYKKMKAARDRGETITIDIV